MVTREEALEYFMEECQRSGVPAAHAESMQEDSWKYWCYTAPPALRGPGVTYIVKATGDVYNFGSNPLVSGVIRAESYEQFLANLHTLCEEKGWKQDNETELGKVGKIGV